MIKIITINIYIIPSPEKKLVTKHRVLLFLSDTDSSTSSNGSLLYFLPKAFEQLI